MIPHISPTDPRPIYQQIVEHIQCGLVSGSLRADDRLPSVRELAVMLRINPNTVQQAYRELERLGMIRVERGQGSFIATDAAETQRNPVHRRVAEAAIREARKAGMEVEELIAMIRHVQAAATRRRGAA